MRDVTRQHQAKGDADIPSRSVDSSNGRVEYLERELRKRDEDLQSLRAQLLSRDFLASRERDRSQSPSVRDTTGTRRNLGNQSSPVRSRVLEDLEAENSLLRMSEKKAVARISDLERRLQEYRLDLARQSGKIILDADSSHVSNVRQSSHSEASTPIDSSHVLPSIDSILHELAQVERQRKGAESRVTNLEEQVAENEKSVIDFLFLLCNCLSLSALSSLLSFLFLRF